MSNVYFISDGTGIKIGVANDITKRLSQLQTGNPNKLAVFRYIEVTSDSEAFTLEGELHKKYSKYKMIGEWFSVTKELLLKDLSSNYQLLEYVPQSSNYAEFTKFGNGVNSLDILEVCKHLKNAELTLLQIFRDSVKENLEMKEVNSWLVTPAKLENWNDTLRVYLKKHYSNMYSLGILKRVKKGTYMINPSLVVPSTRDRQYVLTEWEQSEAI